jgi:hypothetical protein
MSLCYNSFSKNRLWGSFGWVGSFVKKRSFWKRSLERRKEHKNRAHFFVPIAIYFYDFGCRNCQGISQSLSRAAAAACLPACLPPSQPARLPAQNEEILPDEMGAHKIRTMIPF